MLALEAVLGEITATLDRLELRHTLGGSVAASIYGIPRSTNDLDILVELEPGSAAALACELQPAWYVPDEAMSVAVGRHSSFSVMHRQLKWKVDLFVAGGCPLDGEQLERCASVSLSGSLTRPVNLASAELIVLRKLEWFHRRIGSCDVHWFDALGILKVQAGRLDEAWMRRAAAGLGITELLDRALRLQGPPPR